MVDKNAYISGITPAGIAIWPKLNKADTKFNKDGVFSVKLKLTDSDAAPIIANMEKLIEGRHQEALEKYAGKKDAKGRPIEVIKAEAPFAVDLDDQGQPTGHKILQFKMKATRTDKTGKVIPQAPRGFDAKGNPSKAEVWGGSKLKIDYQLGAYFAEDKKTAGCAVYLRNYQILELVSGGGSAFKAEEGYEEPSDAGRVPAQTQETQASFGGTDAAEAAGNF